MWVGDLLPHLFVSNVLGEHQTMDQRRVLLLTHRDLEQMQKKIIIGPAVHGVAMWLLLPYLICHSRSSMSPSTHPSTHPSKLDSSDYNVLRQMVIPFFFLFFGGVLFFFFAGVGGKASVQRGHTDPMIKKKCADQKKKKGSSVVVMGCTW